MSTQAIATAKEVFDLLRDDLSAIETELVRDAVSNVGAITDIADHLREGGGKRIRPSLLLLAAKSLGYHGHGMVRLGAVVEMPRPRPMNELMSGPAAHGAALVFGHLRALTGRSPASHEASAATRTSLLPTLRCDRRYTRQ